MHPEVSVGPTADACSTLWPACLDILARELPEQQVNTWIQPLTARLAPDHSRLTVYVGNRFKPGQAQRTEVALAFGRHDTLPTDTPLFWQLVADLLLPMIAHTQDAALETDA